MTLREQIIAEIMKLVRPAQIISERKPTIDELEKILNSDDRSVTSINPDGTVSIAPPPCTVGDVADAVLRVFDAHQGTAQMGTLGDGSLRPGNQQEN